MDVKESFSRSYVYLASIRLARGYRRTQARTTPLSRHRRWIDSEITNSVKAKWTIGSFLSWSTPFYEDIRVCDPPRGSYEVYDISQVCYKRKRSIVMWDQTAIICFRVTSWPISPKVCQMLSWWTKNWPHSIIMWVTVTDMVPLCSAYHAPSYKSGLTLLA